MQALLPTDIETLPQPFAPEEAERACKNFLESLKEEDVELFDYFSTALKDKKICALLDAVFGNSPYLTTLITRYPATLREALEKGVAPICNRIFMELDDCDVTAFEQRPFMQYLRQCKSQMALLTALADICHHWELQEITYTLSQLAEVSVSLCLKWLLHQSVNKGQIKDAGDNHGIFILGMGKLGAYELNYSSDIDLIILYNPDKIEYLGRQSTQHFTSRLAQDLVTLMQERTADGYVFRTDLRLRPDPSSTPPAVRTNAALHYYETVGQNWERAAMIKARFVAGDRAECDEFIKNIQPFMWRKHLDFAAITDILSIKRQMHSKTSEQITAYDHNIKTGRGGIREIEFLGHINQLIWGGRFPELRIRGAIPILEILTQKSIIKPSVCNSLSSAYTFLRTVEHRLQMIDDQQTHTLPDNEEDMDRLAVFLGYQSAATFVPIITRTLKSVHRYYNAAFRESTPLGDKGQLVFTGVDHDPRTIETIRNMGFDNPEKISSAVQDWHKGQRRCTRSKRARQLLTELVPDLLRALSNTINPDAAFQRFDEFMMRLPDGIQVFSLFASNTDLLTLVADIIGSAPALGETLSLHPQLLYAVITTDFYGDLQDKESLTDELAGMLSHTHDHEDALGMLHMFLDEKQFQAGVQLLKTMNSAETTGHFLSDLAEVVLEAVVNITLESFTESYGIVPDSSLSIIAMGKLGSRELTFGSDLDILFLYDTANEQAVSTGSKELSPSGYYNRLAQRIIGTLTALGKHGRLYDIDTRLRPFGNDGPVAVSLTAFDQYYKESAWVFERLALARARIVYTDAETYSHINATLRKCITRKLEKKELLAGLVHIREKIDESYHTDNPWDIKYVWGGLLDIDFILQSLIVEHGRSLGTPPYLIPDVLRTLKRKKLVEAELLDDIGTTREFMTTLLYYLRLCSDGSIDVENATEGIKHILTTATGEESFPRLNKHLLKMEKRMHKHFRRLSKLI